MTQLSVRGTVRVIPADLRNPVSIGVELGPLVLPHEAMLPMARDQRTREAHEAHTGTEPLVLLCFFAEPDVTGQDRVQELLKYFL